MAGAEVKIEGGVTKGKPLNSLGDDAGVID
jgi:hypothetical protein